MKKFLKFIFVLFVIVCLVFDGLLIWHRAQPVNSFDIPSVALNGEAAMPVSGAWRTPTLMGYYSKTTPIYLNDTEPGNRTDIGKIGSKTVKLETPSRASAQVIITKSPDTPQSLVVFNSTDDIYEKYEYSENGKYNMAVNLTFEPTGAYDALKLSYSFDYEIDVQPVVTFSQKDATQADIICAYVDMGLSNKVPEIETELGEAVFIPLENNEYVAYIPVGFAQTPGQYTVTVRADDVEESCRVKVNMRDYSEQHMTISQETVDATRGAAGANEDYAKKIKTTFTIFDNIKYWTEPFIQPVQGRISTEFGLYRYTNGSKTATRHTGIDIAAAEGTNVPASNAGRVVFAGDVIITGNSVVIEHGGGLKTYYYHLSAINVKEGDLVEQGDIIGKVGSTGYATGPHLHFEVKLGEYPLSPWALFDGSSSIYQDPAEMLAEARNN